MTLSDSNWGARPRAALVLSSEQRSRVQAWGTRLPNPFPLPGMEGRAGAAATRGRQDIAQRMEPAEGRSSGVKNPHLCGLWLCCGSSGKGCECRAWTQVGITWGYELRVVRGINAAKVTLGVPNGCKACGGVSRRPGNVCRISAFLSQNWFSYLIEQNSPLLEPPVPAHEAGPGGKAVSFSLAEV